jgi:hypothetical protein
MAELVWGDANETGVAGRPVEGITDSDCAQLVAFFDEQEVGWRTSARMGQRSLHPALGRPGVKEGNGGSVKGNGALSGQFAQRDL